MRRRRGRPARRSRRRPARRRVRARRGSATRWTRACARSSSAAAASARCADGSTGSAASTGDERGAGARPGDRRRRRVRPPTSTRWRRAIDTDRSVLVIGEPGSGRTARLRALGARSRRGGAGSCSRPARREINAGRATSASSKAQVAADRPRARRRARAVDRPALRGAAVDGHAPPQPHRRARHGPAAGWRTRSCTSRARSTPRATSGCCASARPCASAFEPLRIQPATEAAARGARPRRGARRRRGRRGARARPPLPAGRAARVGALAARRHAPRAGDAYGVNDVLESVAERSGMPLTMLDERERLDVDGAAALLRRARRRPARGGRADGRAGRAAQGRADRSRPGRWPCCCSSARPARARPRSPRRWRSTCSAARPDDPDRHVRVPEPRARARRLLGTGEPEDASLVASIRKQPFSVVLLDEFEKADRGVFDLFLQVFDDGRLSDPRGEAADFRHAVIIMTSNLGATIPTGAGIGFSPAAGGFVARSVEQAVTQDVPARVRQPDRPHRRLPAVVAPGDARDPCAPSSSPCWPGAACARAQWAVEFDDSALEFLLNAGLHARPRRAAVEARGRAALPDAVGAGHRRARRARAATSSCSSAPARRPEGDVRGPGRAGARSRPRPAETTLRTLAREGGAGLDLLEAAFADVSAAAGGRGRGQGRAARADGRAGLLGGRRPRRGARRDRAARPHGGRPALRPVAAEPRAQRPPPARRDRPPRRAAAAPARRGAGRARRRRARRRPRRGSTATRSSGRGSPRCTAPGRTSAGCGWTMRRRSGRAASSASTRRSPASPRCGRWRPRTGSTCWRSPTAAAATSGAACG